MAEQSQLQEMSQQLIGTVEQSRMVERQLQLGKNQKQKTVLTLAEVEKNTGSQAMYRSAGRMFMMCSKEELAADLNNDLTRIEKESERNEAMKQMLDTKKDQLTKQLNDMAPGQQQ